MPNFLRECVARELASSLRRQHMDAVSPYLSGPPVRYSLDPVWSYFRRGSG